MTEQQNVEGWQMVRFGDIAKQISMRVEPRETKLKVYVGLEHLDPGSLKIKRHGVPSDVAGQKLLVKKGQIIFGKRRAYQRKVAVTDFDCICSAHAMVLEAIPGKIIPEFLPFYMQSDEFMNRAVSISEGSLSPTIKWKTLERQKFKIPPIDIQNRMLRLLKKSNSVINGYYETEDSLLKLADRIIEARLEAIKAEHVSFESLLETGDLIDIQDGNHGNDHPKASEYVEEGIPFVMANDLNGNDVDLKRCKKLPKNRTDALRIGFSFPGDILLSHKGTVGLVAVTPEVQDYIMLTPQVTYYRVNKNGRIKPKFLELYFRSFNFQRTLKNQAAQSTRAYIGIKAQKKLTIPVASETEQEEIIKLWDQLKLTASCIRASGKSATLLSKQLING